MSLQQVPQQLGKYELRERLGRGGMAEVWKAFDTQLHRYVAIKILHTDFQADPEFTTRFTREARAIASLHHPNIVQIHDFQTTQATESSFPIAYMVMDYVEGQTLAQYIHSTSHVGKFPSPTEIVPLFTSISKAIDYAHEHGMIHRDIKPANILLDKRNTAINPMGEPVLTDFGIAKLIDVSSGTMSGMWLGTPLYISPEQALGQPGNERSDLYSLGIILYEICSGVQPFRGEGATAIRQQQIHSTPIAPTLINPNIPPALALVILRTIAKNPANRFSSASAMTTAIAEALNLPIPQELAPSLDNTPTYIRPIQPGFPQGIMPPAVSPTPVLQGSGSLPTVPVFTTFTSVPPSPVSGSGPITPLPPDAHASFPPSPVAQNPGNAATSYPDPVLPPPSPYTFSATSTPWWRRKWLLIALAVVILLLLASSSIGALYLFPGKHTNSTTAITPPKVVGNVYFLSSGQLNTLNSQGVDDEVQIALHNIPNPPSDKSYYAWLSSVPLGGEGPSVLLGTLQVSHGNAQLPSPYHDPQSANLLLNASSFLVTEESSSVSPVAPSTDRSTWRFSSEPPLTTLLHLRHLLAGSPELAARQLDGGLGIGLSRNTEKVVEWAVSARDDNPLNIGFIYRQLLRILYYIDGEGSVSMDVQSADVQSITQHDAQIVHNAQVALVGPPIQLQPPGTTYKGEVAPGYVYLIQVHLKAAVEAPQATAEQHQLATQIESDLNQVTLDLKQAQMYAKDLLPLIKGAKSITPQAQLYLNDLATATAEAYRGSTDPTQSQGSVTEIYRDLQQMAVFDVQPSAQQ